MEHRILIISPPQMEGGLKTFTRQLAKHLPNQEFKAYFLLSEPGTLSQLLNSQGHRTYLAPSPPQMTSPRSQKLFLKQIRDICNDNKIDLIFSLSSSVALLASLASRQLGIPHVWFQDNPSGISDQSAALLPHAGLITPSHFTAQRQRTLESKFRWFVSRHIPIEKILIGSDIQGLDESTRQLKRLQTLNSLGLYNQPDDITLIGALGPLTERKGYHILLQALESLKKMNIEKGYYVLIWGDWSSNEDYRRKLIRKIEQNKLPVYLMGPAEKVEESLGICDVFVNASLEQESNSQATIEALTLGLAVIAPSHGSIPELIQNGENGLLYPPRDHLALADRLRLLLQENNHRQNLIDKAKLDATTKLSIEKSMDHIRQFFAKVILSKN